jgi:hypothetical protein
LCCAFGVGKLGSMPEPVIDRDEVVALLFDVSDIVATLSRKLDAERAAGG